LNLVLIADVQGIWTPKGEIENENAGPPNPHPSGLVDFGGKGKYGAPEFIWFQTVVPTALKFLNSTKLGKQYQNNMFIGDYNNGNLYYFKLNQDRTGLVLGNTLANKIAYTPESYYLKVAPLQLILIISYYCTHTLGLVCLPFYKTTPCSSHIF
jgi:hypothetical protein